MRTSILSIIALIVLAGVTALHGEVTTPADTKGAPQKKSGYTVTVEFYVNSGGAVTNEKVLTTEAEVLNEFALPMVKSGRMNPLPLPIPGSEPKRVTSELFFPVESYDSGRPLPTGVILPKARFQPSPPFPFDLLKKKITGGARISLTVGKSGHVTDCKVIKASHREFGEVAVDAVYKWLFIPATLNGKPVEVTLNVPISFEIAGATHGWKWLVAPEPTLSGFVCTSYSGEELKKALGIH